MTYDRFLKIALGLQKIERVIQTLYDNGLDITNFVDPYYTIISELLLEVYGEEGHDWFSWFCYENNFGTGGLTANDKEGNPICHSFESLYEYLEVNCKK